MPVVCGEFDQLFRQFSLQLLQYSSTRRDVMIHQGECDRRIGVADTSTTKRQVLFPPRARLDNSPCTCPVCPVC